MYRHENECTYMHADACTITTHTHTPAVDWPLLPSAAAVAAVAAVAAAAAAAAAAVAAAAAAAGRGHPEGDCPQTPPPQDSWRWAWPDTPPSWVAAAGACTSVEGEALAAPALARAEGGRGEGGRGEGEKNCLDILFTYKQTIHV